MSAARLGLYSALGAAAAWAAKALAIGLVGGLERSVVEGPLFLLGLLFALVAAGALGAAVAHTRGTPHRVVAAVLAIVAVTVLAAAMASAFAAVAPSDPGWAWSEVNLWVVAASLVAAATAVWRRQSEG
jgi:fucose 4-O-acetylase-like acetyltransferase